ncbi:MAG: hypothetical protein NUV64_00440 [Parcubacteria group bacterium]|nr:hypothetical protein [Parcubacteria group bacterium]MCR4342514.1 hypothetical protein [Patescibacteria group bacterium]
MKRHSFFVILCLILVIYLGIKTLSDDGWGGWLEGIGDAATLLSSKHWSEDGFIYSKFLFLPMGYSKTVKYFDEPEMRQHARGTVTGGMIGRRLYYTHYPSGYLIPYALLMKAGFVERHWFRLLALFFSFGSLILMYWFFNLIATRSVAFFAAFYYGISTMFLDFADSLANQPVDDLFRFSILVLSVLAVKSIDNLKKYEIYNVFIWFLYFALASSSYDSTFFIFVWLVGLDLITVRKFLWKKWLIFTLAPVAAFGLQIIQNWWYLRSWKDVFLDISGTSSARVQTSNILSHIKQVFFTFNLASGLKTVTITLMVIILLTLLYIFRGKISQLYKNYINDSFKLSLFQIMIILFLAGALYPFVLAGTGGFSYQGRQVMPFLALLIGVSTVLAIRLFKIKEKTRIFPQIILIFTLIFLWGWQIYRTTQYIYAWPNNKPDARIIEIGDYLESSRTGDSVVFYLGDRLPLTLLTEYYLNMPFLFFKDESSLVRDFLWLKEHSEYSFDTFIISDRKGISDNLHKLLLKESVNETVRIKFIAGEYLFKLSF